VNAARKAFGKFPMAVQDQILRALTVAADGEMSDKAKPMLGLGSGIYEVALKYRTDAYRTVYAVQLGEDIWVVHAFQKKSTKGRKTPQPEIDVIKELLKRLKKELQQ
jgi:phage-related protein